MFIKQILIPNVMCLLLQKFLIPSLIIDNLNPVLNLNEYKTLFILTLGTI
jgi:hypothetical protein